MNTVTPNHPDPNVRLVIYHMLNVYRRFGCAVVGEDFPFEPLFHLPVEDAIEVVDEAFAEMERMGILNPEHGNSDRRGAAFPKDTVCAECAALEVTARRN